MPDIGPRFIETFSDLWQCTSYRRDWDYEALVTERDRYRHALANIIARFGAKPLPKNEDEHGAYYEAEQMSMIAEEALGAERS